MSCGSSTSLSNACFARSSRLSCVVIGLVCFDLDVVEVEAALAIDAPACPEFRACRREVISGNEEFVWVVGEWEPGLCVLVPVLEVREAEGGSVIFGRDVPCSACRGDVVSHCACLALSLIGLEHLRRWVRSGWILNFHVSFLQWEPDRRAPSLLHSRAVARNLNDRHNSVAFATTRDWRLSFRQLRSGDQRNMKIEKIDMENTHKRGSDNELRNDMFVDVCDLALK